MAEPAEAQARVSRRAAVVVTLLSLAAVMLGVEAASRVLLPNRYFVWPPNFSMMFDAGEHIGGVEFPSHLTINSQGFRGDRLDDSYGYRVLAVGGSTTICVYLDDATAWPHLVQKRLDDTLGVGSVWVGNVGRPGHMTREHVLQVEALLAQHPEIDAVILLIGVNDMLRYIPRAGKPLKPEDPELVRRMAFSFFPGWDDATPWYKRNIVARVWTMASWHPWGSNEDQLRPEDEKGEFVAMVRRYRKRASRLRPRLPDLRPGLAEYAGHVNQIIDIAKQAGADVFLMTQPTLWRDGLSPEERDLLWAGGPDLMHLRDGAVYPSIQALARGMQRYNETTLAVCESRGVACLDAAPLLPRTREYFYDDAHFTDRGSARLADAVATFLLEQDSLRERVGAARRP